MVGERFAGGDGTVLGVGTVSFMAAPDPSMTMPAGMDADDGSASRRGRLRVPFAERARCEVREAGVAVLQRSTNGLNASNTVQGGLIALAAEEAALSLTPGYTLASMSLRYLRPVRVGPAVATAAVKAGLSAVEVCDEGSDGRLAVYAVTRTFDDASTTH
nr:hypothetical protein [Micromonospora sp. DSM 115978]